MQAHLDLRDQMIGRTRGRRDLWVGVVLLLLLSVILRLIDLDRLPVTDELYTSLAAQGWLHEGEPRIGDGIYPRAQLYTLLLGGWFAVFGESIVSARLLSVVAGTLLVIAVFVWTRSAAGTLAAWIAGLFVAMEPMSVQISQFARFYALHALIFWLASIGVYSLVAGRLSPRGRVLVALGVGVGFPLAAHLQLLTLIGLLGLGVWLLLAVAIPRLRALDRQRRRTVLAVAAGLILISAGALLAFNVVDPLLHRYRSAPLWNREHHNEFWFYHVFFVERYPTLWSLTPLAILVAAIHRPRVASFCTCIFVVGFVLLSFGGMKDERYMFFCLPFLFVLWGIALARGFELLYPWVLKRTDRVVRRLAPYLPRRPVRAGLLGAGLIFLIAANGGMVKALMLFTGTHLVAGEGGAAMTSKLRRTDWAAARPALERWIDQASVVLTSRDVHFLYYLGDYDFVVSRNRMSEINGREFDRDPRTGRPVVTEPASLRLIVDCYPSGLIVVEVGHWRDPSAVSDKLADAIEAATTPITEIPPESQLKAFRWQHPADRPRPADCAALPPPRSGRSA